MAAKKTVDNEQGRGRNPRAGEPAKPFTINLTTAERAKFQKAADKVGQKLGDWLRAAAEAWIKRSGK